MVFASSVPRLLQLDLAKQWTQNSSKWSPRELLARFPQSHSLTVKRSTTSRYFMYEEHASSKLKDDNVTQVIQCSPSELATLLHKTGSKEHYYWTSPIADVAPNILEEVPNFQSLHSMHNTTNPQLLDPRGPSLWMGTPGSVTQAHYDVADNVLIQLYGTKRIRCYPPSAATCLYVFPDAHPRARKSQVHFDDLNLTKHPRFQQLEPPQLDAILQPGDAISIPAFWFHHVENGYSSSSEATVSLNLFALSKSMMIAQQAFQQASQVVIQHPHPVSILHTLISVLWERVGRNDWQEWVQVQLLETRYVPLGYRRQSNDSVQKELQALSTDEQQQIEACMDRVVPLLQALDGDDHPGVLELVLAHLLELWAVERVGANRVAEIWDQVLLAAKS